MRLALSVARLAAALAAAVSLAACGGTVDLLVEKDLTINSAVAGGAVLAQVDLAAEAGGAWKHRDRVSSVAVTLAEAEVLAVYAPPNTAATVSGTVWLLPDGQTSPGAGAVQLGTFTDLPVAVGQVVQLQPSAAIDAFLEGALKGTGRFVVYAEGSGAGGAVVSCLVHARLGAAVKWKAP